MFSLFGVCALDTICLLGNLAHEPVILLIDLGSIHNFMSERLAENAGLHSINNEHLEVMVASRETLASPSKCFHTQLNLQNYLNFVDFYLLPLEGYGVFLGTKWLNTLGPIEWDFSKLSMKFVVGGNEIILQGLSSAENPVVTSHEFRRLSKNEEALLQMFPADKLLLKQSSVHPLIQ